MREILDAIKTPIVATNNNHLQNGVLLSVLAWPAHIMSAFMPENIATTTNYISCISALLGGILVIINIRKALRKKKRG